MIQAPILNFQTILKNPRNQPHLRFWENRRVPGRSRKGRTIVRPFFSACLFIPRPQTGRNCQTILTINTARSPAADGAKLSEYSDNLNVPLHSFDKENYLNILTIPRPQTSRKYQNFLNILNSGNFLNILNSGNFLNILNILKVVIKEHMFFCVFIQYNK